MSNVGRVCMEPAKRARPWGTSITQTASPAALVVSKAVILWVSIMLFTYFLSYINCYNGGCSYST